jgi:AraC-like DNA-binding protein
MLYRKIGSLRIRVMSYFFLQDHEAFKLPTGTYKGWSLLTCEKGKFRYKVGDEEGEAQVGEAVLCPPGVPLDRRALTNVTFHFTVFLLDTALDGEDIVFPYQGKLTFRNPSRFLSTLAALRESMDNLSRHYTEHLLGDILYQYVDERAAFNKEMKPRDPSILEAVRYINEQAFDEVSMQTVAAHVGLSQSQFTRKFQKEVGQSPIKYLTQLRLQKVKLMLLETDDSLETIAERCGYRNAFYLSRVFSSEMSISPSVYRSTHRV